MKLPPFKLTFSSTLVLLALSHPAYASIVRNDVDYQYFRDLAENKGKFAVGASNIPVFNKKGENVGTMLPNVPMVDFSVINRTDGIATLVSPQHIMSVAHNVNYDRAGFGGTNANPDSHHFDYLFTNRNNYRNQASSALPLPSDPEHSANYTADYHLPRLHKLVTETAPAAMAEDNLNAAQFFDPNKYSHFIRAGSGMQKLRGPASEDTTVAEYYKYLTGGVPMPLLSKSHDAISFGRDFYNTKYGPLVNFMQVGDSGSGMFAYNVEKKRWEVMATLTSISKTMNNYVLNRPNYLQDIAKSETLRIRLLGGTLNWSNGESGKSTLSIGRHRLELQTYAPHLAAMIHTPKARPALGFGKNLSITGAKGTLNLTENINQGAGGLYFDTDFVVTAANPNLTWQGAGVSVAAGKTVDWRVKNPKSDRLSKIGQGTLLVNGTGDNEGDLSVGDGTVILAQKGGRAFNEVGIVSGRPTLKLADDKQLDLDKLYFGFRGGRLDTNGLNLHVNYLQNVDEGAQVVNHNTAQAANLTISGHKMTAPSDLRLRPWGDYSGEVFEYNRDGKMRYFAPKTQFLNQYFPVKYGDSNTYWEFLSGNKAEALNIVAERRNQPRRTIAFNGYLGETDPNKPNGALNVRFEPNNPAVTLLLSGGTRLNGTLAVSNGSMVLSGRPTPHAYDFLNKKEVYQDDDWINRNFNATTISASNHAKLYVGRNVSGVNANFTAQDHATLSLGVINGHTPECIRSDHTGLTSCANTQFSAASLAHNPTTQIKGDVQLDGSSRLHVGKANLTGKISGSGLVDLHGDSRWTLTDSSTLAHLHLHQGAEVNLNGSEQNYHTLYLSGNLSGTGLFHLNSNITSARHDKIVVQGTATGTHRLQVNDRGSEPKRHELELLKVHGENQDKSQLSVSLANAGGYVDLGTFRYRLFEKDNSYTLATDTPPPPPPVVTPPAQPAKPAAAAQPAKPSTTAGKPVRKELVQAKPNRKPVKRRPVRKTNRFYRSAEPDFEYENLYDTETAYEYETENENEFDGENAYNDEGSAAENNSTQNNGENENGENENDEQPTLAADPAQAAEFARQQGEPNNTQPAAQPAAPNEVVVGDSSDAANADAARPTAPDAAQAVVSAPRTVQADRVSRYANAAISELSAQGNVLLGIGARLDREIAHVDEQGVRVWAEAGKQSGKFSDKLYRPYSQDITLTQIGVENVSGETTLGGVLSRSTADSQFDDAIKGKNTLHQLDLYAKQRFSHGVFAALDAGFGKAESKVGDAAFSRSVASLGATIGARWQAENGLYLAPSLGARHYRLGGSRYVFDGAVVAIKPLHLTSYQAGVSIGKRFDFGSFSITPEFASHAQAVKSAEKTVSVNGNALSHQFGSRFKHELSVGVQKGGLSVGLSAGVQLGGQLDRQRSANIKIGYRW